MGKDNTGTALSILAMGLANAGGGGTGGASTWGQLEEKPFETISETDFKVGRDGELQVNFDEATVANADQLLSPGMQTTQDFYSFRTTGGTASVKDGTAKIGYVYGNCENPDYKAAHNAQVTEFDAWPRDSEVSYTFDPDTFLAKMVEVGADNQGFMMLSYWDGRWQSDYEEEADPAEYGFSISGDVAELEECWAEIEYNIDEVRGQIHNVHPVQYVANGYNQAEWKNGQQFLAAHVVGGQKYAFSKNPVYEITYWDGSTQRTAPVYYFILKNEPTDKQELWSYDVLHGFNNADFITEVIQGHTIDYCFTAPVTGWLVAATNSAIHNVYIQPGFSENWKDSCLQLVWSGYKYSTDYSFENPAPTTSTVVLPTEGTDGSTLAYTTLGLSRIGTVCDELDFQEQQYIQRIERVDYSAETIEELIAAGTSYIYDEDYIYYVLETPLITSFNESGYYICSDFGTETIILDDNYPVCDPEIFNIYGYNLKDKLRQDVVTLSQQSLSDGQISQVKKNLKISYDIKELRNNVVLVQHLIDLYKNESQRSLLSEYQWSSNGMPAFVNVAQEWDEDIEAVRYYVVAAGTSTGGLDMNIQVQNPTVYYVENNQVKEYRNFARELKHTWYWNMNSYTGPGVDGYEYNTDMSLEKFITTSGGRKTTLQYELGESVPAIFFWFINYCVYAYQSGYNLNNIDWDWRYDWNLNLVDCSADAGTERPRPIYKVLSISTQNNNFTVSPSTFDLVITVMDGSTNRIGTLTWVGVNRNIDWSTLTWPSIVWTTLATVNDIPSIPECPTTTDGTFKLTCSIVGGVPTYTWETEV